jgi:ATPase subunit of ABC transporter with duplicated ATPase domains
MSQLFSLHNAELAYGLHPLLDGASLRLVRGERIGLIRRNGIRKSSLLHVIAGQAALDAGEVIVSDGARVVLVKQEPELPAAPTLRVSLAGFFGEVLMTNLKCNLPRSSADSDSVVELAFNINGPKYSLSTAACAVARSIRTRF